jgi:regulatory protein
MKQDMTYEMALHRAAALCSAGEKCEFDIREKLQNWGISSDESNKIVQRLLDEKFLNNERFALSFVKDKFRFNKWGKIKIAYALKQKQIDSSLIQESLNSIDDEEYQDLLRDLIQSKLKGLKYKDKYDMQAKLYRFAQGRGFESNVVSRIVSQFSS